MRGIYKITNTINSKVYIGESLDIRRRWEEHLESLNNNKHHSYKLQSDWNEYGKDNFEFQVVSVLDDCINIFIDQYILLIYEHEYMKKYDSLNNGYNVEDTLKEIQKGNKTIGNSTEKDTGVLKKYSNEIKDKIIKEMGGIIYLDSKLFSMEDIREAINLTKGREKFKDILLSNNFIIPQGKTYILNENIFDKIDIVRNNRFSKIKINERLYLELVDKINKILESDKVSFKTLQKENNEKEDKKEIKDENEEGKLIKNADESKIEKDTMRDFVYILEKNDFRFKCKYNEIFSILRNENIFYYDDNNNNVVNEEYVKKEYFSNNKVISKNKTYNKILITKKGKEFLFDKLMELNYLSKVDEKEN